MTQKIRKVLLAITILAFALCLVVQASAQDESASVRPNSFKVVPSTTVRKQVEISIDLRNVKRNLTLEEARVAVFFYNGRKKYLGRKVYEYRELKGGEPHAFSESHPFPQAKYLNGKLGLNGADILGGGFDRIGNDAHVMVSSAGQVFIPTSEADPTPTPSKPTPTPRKYTPTSNLAAPTLMSPKANAVFDYYPRKLILQWNTVPGAVSYTVEWDCFHCCETNKWCSDLGKATGVKSGLTTIRHSIEFGGAQPGRWRVWAVDANGKSGPKSEWREFRFTK